MAVIVGDYTPIGWRSHRFVNATRHVLPGCSLCIIMGMPQATSVFNRASKFRAALASGQCFAVFPGGDGVRARLVNVSSSSIFNLTRLDAGLRRRAAPFRGTRSGGFDAGSLRGFGRAELFLATRRCMFIAHPASSWI